MKFNIVYIEKKIKNHLNTKEILSRLNYNKVIFCDNYNQIFNPKNQNFRIQKSSPSVILAKKENNFLLKTPPKFSIGYDRNFYFSHMLNCIYDCKYCFLQGMFNSAHYVIFVNYTDFFNAIQEVVSGTKKDVCFFSGYDCDSLALEKITHFLSFFLLKFKKIKNGILEIRTKSTKIDIFREFKPMKNIIIAFSLNPEDIIEKFEDKTPKLVQRIKAIAELQKLGWTVGLRFDPLIFVDHDHLNNFNFFQFVFDRIDTKRIHSVTIGKFRMPKQFFDKFASIRPNESFLFKNKINKLKNLEIYENEIGKFVNKKKIFKN